MINFFFEVFHSVPDSNAEDVDAAVKAAHNAFKPWAALSAADRAAFLVKIADETYRKQVFFCFLLKKEYLLGLGRGYTGYSFFLLLFHSFSSLSFFHSFMLSSSLFFFLIFYSSVSFFLFFILYRKCNNLG